MNGSGLDIIARIETPFAEKFGVPRQSGIADSPGRIVFEKPFRDVDAVRGLEGFSHIWLIWQFDRAQRQGWSPTVRPPRLGGNERVGVFATVRPSGPTAWGSPPWSWSAWPWTSRRVRCCMSAARIWSAERPS